MNLSNPRVWNRKLHRWGAAVCLLPFLLVVTTGVLLQTKKYVSWIQPTERRGTDGPPNVNLDGILETCRSLPEVGITTWGDIERVDVRPSKGMLKVLAKSRWEVQLDATNGEVLQVAYRRADLIESLHDGSWFHPEARLWVFLPHGLILLVLTLTGTYLWLLPYRSRAKKRALGEHPSPQPHLAARVSKIALRPKSERPRVVAYAQCCVEVRPGSPTAPGDSSLRPPKEPS